MSLYPHIRISAELRSLLDEARTAGPTADAAAVLFMALVASQYGQVHELERMYRLTKPPARPTLR
jgi:hypothetical protein